MGGGVRGTTFIIITEKVDCSELTRGERERVCVFVCVRVM